MLHHFLQQQIDRMNPTFVLFDKDTKNGVLNLDPTLTINSISVTPTLLYYGGDANGTNWAPRTYGETLTLQAGTAPSYNQGSPLVGPYDDSVKFNNGGYYLGSAGFSDITTEDFVIELVFKAPPTGLQTITGTYTSSPNQGYQLVSGLSAGITEIYCKDAAATIKRVGSGSLAEGAWYHLIWFMDRSGSGVCYINGVAGSATDISALGSISSTTKTFTIGRRTDALPYNSAIGYLAMWKRDAWLDTHLQPTIALERFNKLIGIYPQVAKGTITPTVQTRATNAYLDKIDNLIEQCLTDGNMEAADTSAWLAGADASVTKATTNPYSGSRCLRVTRSSGGSAFFAYQLNLVIGRKYRIRGWARSDGTSIPKVFTGAYVWTGTTSTSWQYFDVITIATLTIFRLYAGPGGAPSYSEFDDITVTDLGERYVYQVGSGWLRVTERQDSNGDIIRGYLPETAATNLLVQSDGFSDTNSWTRLNTTETDVIVDGDMEAVGVGDWTPTNGAVLSKESADPHSGTYNLRVTRNGVTNNPIAGQVCVTSGIKYRIRGWWRGDGSCAPGVYLGSYGTLAGVGSVSATWAYFDITKVADGTLVGFRAITSTGVQYAEFDDVTVTQIPDHFANVLLDGDMEGEDTSNWTAGNSAAVSKQSADPYSGIYCLRVAYTDTNYPYASQVCMTVGNTYRITGWARSDGTATMTLGTAGQNFWTGTNSTSWQHFNVLAVPNATSLRFTKANAAAGYAEFDDVQVSEVTVAAPNKATEMMSFVASANDGVHGVSQAATLTADSYAFSCFAKKGSKDWLYLKAAQALPIIVDGDMEGVGVSLWSVGNSATLTKEAGTPHGGSQCLRVAYNTSSSPYAFQTTLVVGRTYRITGWFRGDGTYLPSLWAGTGVTYAGTTSTDWQEFDVVFAPISTSLRLYSSASAAGYCEFDDITVEDVGTYSYFDLNNGVVGTAGAGAVGYIENWGNGIYRCCLVHTGAAKSFNHYIQSAHADTDDTFAGDGVTISSYVWGAMSELNDYMTSYVPTTTAVATRNADVLTYAGDNGNLGGVGSELQGAIRADVLFPAYTNSVFLYMITLSDGGATSDRVAVVSDQNTTMLRAVTASGGGNAGSTVSTSTIMDNVIHRCRATWKTNSVKLVLDGLPEGTEDTSADPPNDLDVISVGSRETSLLQLNGLVSNIKIYKKPTRK
jgi:hypothetical protein